MPREVARVSRILSFTFSILLMSQLSDLACSSFLSRYDSCTAGGGEGRGADTHFGACECLFAGRGTCGRLARGYSTDSHGQGRDVHPLGEEC